MAILVRSGAPLRAYLKPDLDAYTRRLDPGGDLSVRELMARLGIPEGLVAFGIVDGRLLELDDRVSDGSTVVLQTPAGGG